MAIITINNTTKITCDKCGATSIAPAGCYNKVFFAEGWSLFPNAKKYIHKCYKCLPAKSRKARDFVIEKFGL